MEALFTAMDISGLSTSVSAVLVSFVGVNLLYLAYRYVKKTMNRG